MRFRRAQCSQRGVGHRHTQGERQHSRGSVCPRARVEARARASRGRSWALRCGERFLEVLELWGAIWGVRFSLRRIHLRWGAEEGRWYRGGPPLPGSSHRTTMVPELQNIGRRPRFCCWQWIRGIHSGAWLTAWHRCTCAASVVTCTAAQGIRVLIWRLQVPEFIRRHSRMQLHHA